MPKHQLTINHLRCKHCGVERQHGNGWAFASRPGKCTGRPPEGTTPSIFDHDWEKISEHKE